MNLKQKYILAASLCFASAHLQAVGEVPNVIAGALFGAGYKKIFQSTSTAAAIPLTAAAIGAEFFCFAVITSRALRKNEIRDIAERRDNCAQNFLLIYGASIVSALALNSYEKYTSTGSDEIDPHQKSK